MQTIVGGNITMFSELCEKTRAEAFDMMFSHAEQIGANAVRPTFFSGPTHAGLILCAASRYLCTDWEKSMMGSERGYHVQCSETGYTEAPSHGR